MTIEEMKDYKWSVSWSGGKDSTATIILMHENNIPIEEILYVKMMYDEDTPATLPVMTNFVESAINTFESWGYTVKVVPSKQSAKDLMNRVYTRSVRPEKNGKFYGVSSFGRAHCNFTLVKRDTCATLSSGEFQMIGIAADEPERLARLTSNKQSILATLNITENEALEICKKYELLSPLYGLGLGRDGCWFCPNAANKERELIKRDYPELMLKIKEMIEMCDYDISNLAGRNNWVKDYVNLGENWDKPKEIQPTLWDCCK